MMEFVVSNHPLARLEEEIGDKNGRIIPGLLLLLISIPLSILLNEVIFVFGVAIFLILLASSFAPGTKERVLREGIRGEEVLRNKLRQILSDEYIAFFNLPLKKGDIDVFVVGPAGVYVLDAKNHRGAILYLKERWVQKKQGRNGKVYDADIKDFSPQIKEEIFEIKNFLSREGVNVWVEAAIVFTSPEVQVFSDNPKFFKILKIDEVETLFNRNGSVLESSAIEKIANLIHARYGRVN